MYLGVSGLSGGPRGLPCIRQDLSLQSPDPPVVVGLSAGPWGLPCIRQDLSLQSTDPPVMAGLSRGPRGLPCIRQDLQSTDPQSWRGSALACGLLSAWASAPAARGLPPRPACSPAAPQHVGFLLPSPGSNLRPLRCKAGSQLLDHQGGLPPVFLADFFPFYV